MTMTDQDLIDHGYIEGKKSFEYLSGEIYKKFNWEKVHKAMVAVNWHWYFGKDNMGIPSLDTIKNHAYALLRRTYDEGINTHVGGFSAFWDGGELFLEFTLEAASVI